MKECLVLYGKANVGKTTTLKILIECLEKRGAVIEKEKVIGNDRCVIAKYHNKRIGVTTRGDLEASLEEDLEWFEKEKANICICASRTRGKTCEKIKEKCKFEIVWFGKAYLGGTYSIDTKDFEKKINEMQAEMMQKEIDNRILK